MAYRKTRVLIVDDSMLFREMLSRELSKDFGIEVVGTAEDPFEATKMINELRPDVLTLDVEMPKMSGIEFLKKLLPQYPIPVVVVSSVAENVFDALDAGAVDFVTKPDKSRGGMMIFTRDLTVKIKIAATAKVVVPEPTKRQVAPRSTVTSSSPIRSGEFTKDFVAIGSSTGGTEALCEVFSRFPEHVPPIIMVQHMPIGFTKSFAERLKRNCQFDVKEAQDGDVLKPDLAILAAGDSHLRVVKTPAGYKIKSAPGEKVSGHCPSVDAMFRSIVDVADCTRVIGVILTGMGRDGAEGMLQMRRRGAYTIGQDERTCIVYGMPKAAYEMGAVKKQLPLQDIAAEIIAQARK